MYLYLILIVYKQLKMVPNRFNHFIFSYNVLKANVLMLFKIIQDIIISRSIWFIDGSLTDIINPG